MEDFKGGVMERVWRWIMYCFKGGSIVNRRRGGGRLEDFVWGAEGWGNMVVIVVDLYFILGCCKGDYGNLDRGGVRVFLRREEDLREEMQQAQEKLGGVNEGFKLFVKAVDK